ncbi:type II restriction endonuclease [Helicobacter sp. 12S02634-8]|uniref:type II restriction endonuclease n=1 Tax=Helicobacter sp. 12S02634-8 TaxID=1476199 RepID=UPI000BA58CDE|nr:type II restriction endonuclease [Helicobacter sp. 12S02634-8]PAF47822.1 type II restriction endonuclease [Helicobacter sp. 12S02634-8]
MTDKENKILLGSQTAKNGFANEQDIANKFNKWQDDPEAKNWLRIMGYVLHDILWVKANILSGHKSDVNVIIQINFKTKQDTQNIQVKLVSNKTGFNQIDKRWLSSYGQLWQIPQNIYTILQYFVGEKEPFCATPKDKRRMFFDEMPKNMQDTLIKWFDQNKILIVSDIIRGRGEFCAEWVLVAQKILHNSRWVLKNINEVLNYYGKGDVAISPKGSLNIGRITMQRKGGDNGRETAQMLQFKIDPTKLFDI